MPECSNSMKILKVGDKAKAACETCQAVTGITYQLRDVPFSDGSDLTKNILAGVCDVCGAVTVIPHQSTPAIHSTLERQRKAVESRLPAHMLDILNLVSVEVGGNAALVPQIVKFYLHALSNQTLSPVGLGHYLSTDLASGKAEKRLSLKGRYVVDDIEILKHLASLPTTTDVVKSVVLKINDDILVQHKEESIRYLSNLVAAAA